MVSKPLQILGGGMSRPTNDCQFQIGMVALLRPRKGTEVLLRSLKTLKEKGETFACKVIGPFETESYELSVKKEVEHMGLDDYVEFLGFRKEVYPLIAGLDVLVLPSIYGEGIPMVAIEAMSLGVPVISTTVEGLPELIPNRSFGILCEPGNALAFADALSFMMNHPEKRHMIGAAGQKRQKELFSVQSMTQGMSKVYDELLKG